MVHKVAVILFHRLDSDSAAANIYSQYQLVKHLETTGSLEKVFCLSKNKSLDIPNNKVIDLSENMFYKILNRTLTFLFRQKSRVLREIIFEWFVNLKLPFANTTKIYFSKPLFPRTCLLANKHNVPVYVRASIAHPRFNLNLIEKEASKFKVESNSSYSDLTRIKRIEACLERCNYLLINLRDKKNNFLFNTYRAFEKKIIPYKTMYVRLPRKPIIVSGLNEEQKFIHISHGNLIKGIPYILKAWKEFKTRSNNKAQLHIIGSLDKDITILLESLKYMELESVYFHGNHEDPFNLIQNPLAFINCSLSEAGPSTIMEALSFGIPVITSSNCGLSDLVVDYHNGIKFNYDSLEELVDSLNWFVINVKKRNQLGRNAINSVDEFSLSYYKDEFTKILIADEVSHSR